MKYVALLRGINVGGQTIKSAELKACFEKAGLAGVKTVLATGNIIFESDERPEKLKPDIEKMLALTFNYPAQVCVVGADRLAEIVAGYPFLNVGPEYHRYIIFTDHIDRAEFADTAKHLDDKLEAIQAGKKVIYWRVLKGHSLDSDFAKQLAKTANKSFSTTRNLNTLEKILAKY